MQLKYIKYVVLFVVLIFIVGCAPKETPTPETTATPETTPAVEPTTPETPAQEPAKTVEQTPEETLPAGEGKEVTTLVATEKERVDVTPESAEFSEVTCSDKKISIKITNTGQKEWVLEKEGDKKANVKIMNRGLTDATPECAKKVLAAGETTVCTGIDTGFYKGENRVAVNTPDGSFVRIVNCNAE